MQDSVQQKPPADLSYLHEYMEGDQEAIRELIVVFHETFQENMEQLKTNAVEGESTEWTELAHKLKGAAAFIGAHDLSSHCALAQKMKVATSAERKKVFNNIDLRYQEAAEYLRGQGYDYRK